MNPSHGLSWEKSGEQEGGFATLFILTGKLSGLKFASISTSVTLLVTNRQSLLGSLSDFGLPSNANVFGVFVNCNWAVNVRLAINGNFYAYQIATVSNDATFTLNFVVAYK
ncbi:hypothetical protein [Waltera sp.]|uniref:hypothetical protein n=1 Tax=Waltera sp. TaxID=2815806 RepID=UPI0039A04774